MTDSTFADRIAELADDIANELPGTATALHEIVEEMRAPATPDTDMRAEHVLEQLDPFHPRVLHTLNGNLSLAHDTEEWNAIIHHHFDYWVIAARQLASRAIEPSAGTDAYTMLAATEIANVETTETLMQMLAATILSNLIDEEGGGRANIWYSPDSMSEMMKRYEMDATRDGMITLVTIKPKPGAFSEGRKLLQDSPSLRLDLLESGAGAKEQAPAKKYDRPLWAARVDGKLFPASGRFPAEAIVARQSPDAMCQIENRFCYHDDCPSEKCNHPTEEVTSEG